MANPDRPPPKSMASLCFPEVDSSSFEGAIPGSSAELIIPCFKATTLDYPTELNGTSVEAAIPGSSAELTIPCFKATTPDYLPELDGTSIEAAI